MSDDNDDKKDPTTSDPPGSVDDKKDEKKDPPATDPKTDSPGSADTGSEVEQAVKKVLAEMGIGRQGAPPPTRYADLEGRAEQMVREAAAKLDKEREQEERLANIEKTVKEKTEEVPRKVRRSTKLLWGDDR